MHFNQLLEADGIEPGAGTTFYFELPEWHVQAEMPVREAAADGKRRILVYEDDADVLELIASLLAERAVIESAKTLSKARKC
jgi:hypothetical protein